MEFALTHIQLAVFLAALDVVSDPFGLSGMALSFSRPLHGLKSRSNPLAQTIVTTALPSIIADFNASESDYTWVGSSYMLAAAGT
jgi:hypothetical protein